VSRVLQILGCLVFAGAVCLVSPVAASAHSELVGSTPGEDATVNRAVTSIRLTFESAIDPGLADVVVVGDDDGNRSTGEVGVRGAVVTVPVTALDVAGRYEVSYRVVSTDGHPVTDHFRFEVSQHGARAARALTAAPAPSPGVPAPPAAPQVEGVQNVGAGPVAAAVEPSGAGVLTPELLAVALAVLILVVSLFRRSRLSRKESHV
jgi:copper resistance protein C